MAVWIFKSTDLLGGNGATWDTVGGECPVYAYYPRWVEHRGSMETIRSRLLSVTTAGGVKLCDFDLSTETWGSPYGAINTPRMILLHALYKRPDGSFLLIGEQDGSNVVPAVVYASGAWGTPFEIALNMLALPDCPPTPITNAPKSCMDADGNVYVFWQLAGYTVLPDSTSAGPQSAWYGRAFYQRVAADNSVPSGAGNFYDFPGQDTLVDAGGTFPAAKDGDLAWNTTKRNLTGGQTFMDRGGDCFGKPVIIGTSIFIPIRRKIVGTYAVRQSEHRRATLHLRHALPGCGTSRSDLDRTRRPAATRLLRPLPRTSVMRSATPSRHRICCTCSTSTRISTRQETRPTTTRRLNRAPASAGAL